MVQRKVSPSRRAFLALGGAAVTTAVGGGAAVASGGTGSGESEGTIESPGLGGHREPPVAIRKMLAEVSSERIERSIAKLVSFGTRSTLSSQTDPERGIGAARDWLFEELSSYVPDSGGRLQVELQSYLQGVTPRIPTPTVITNVVATLPGAQPESAGRRYVVSGHYDSRASDVTDGTSDAPGANDDASGVAAVLELARVMSKREWDATLVFMAVAGEEQGLLGARHNAETAREANVDVQGMFTNDIIGSPIGGNGINDPFTVRVFAEGVPTDETPAEANTRRSVGGENDSPARQLARFVKEVGQNGATRMNVEIIYRRDRFGRGGDHIAFLEQGYRSAVRFTEPNEDFDHQHQDVRVENGTVIGDLIEFVDFDYIARVTRVNGAALAALANAPVAPRNVRIAGGLSYDTALRWDPNTEPDLAGYEIVWRSTTEADWTDTIGIGKPDPVDGLVRFTLPNMSKDNFFFGVRALDADGNRSPVVFPRP